MKKRFVFAAVVAALLGIIAVPSAFAGGSKEVTLTVAASGSLQNAFDGDDGLISQFQKKYPNIKIDSIYNRSSELQTQIRDDSITPDVLLLKSVDIPQSVDRIQTLIDDGYINEKSVQYLLLDPSVVVTTSEVTPDGIIIDEWSDAWVSVPVIYPIGVATGSAHTKEANLFVKFLASKDGLAAFANSVDTIFVVDDF
jgi:ABC-type molybdate transport system substrate-binding protein